MPEDHQPGPPATAQTATAQADPEPAQSEAAFVPAEAEGAFAPPGAEAAFVPAGAEAAFVPAEAEAAFVPAEAEAGPATELEADPAFAEAAVAEPESAPADDSPAATAGASGRGRQFALLALAAVTVILGAFGIWATVHASSLRAQAAQQNTALTDPAATSTVRTQIDDAVQAIFSYRYTDTGATRQAAQRLLTGQAIRQYNSLFALVQREAPGEKLVVTTTVTKSGVELLTGDLARVLIFVNQQDTRSGTSQTSYSGAMLAVTAIHEAGRWKIENIDTFT